MKAERSGHLSLRSLISLDQCFLSRLAIERKRNHEFEALLRVLVGAVRGKKALCPGHVLVTKYESLKFQNPVSAAAHTPRRLSQDTIYTPHVLRTSCKLSRDDS